MPEGIDVEVGVDITEKLKQMHALEHHIGSAGMRTLRERGLALAARGETSVSEVLRVTAGNDGV